jgi:hypothetical protein
MHTPASVGADEVPPHEVACLDMDRELEASGHRHVTFVETRDPDGGLTRWSCVQVIAAIEDGERFVVAEDGHGAMTLLEPARCPACDVATLVTDPADAQPGPCE